MKIPVTELVARLRTDPIDDVQAGQLLEAAANRIEELEIERDTLRHGLRLANERISDDELNKYFPAAPVAAQEPDLLPPMNIRNDRDMLNYLMQAFDGEVMVCDRCDEEAPTKHMDSAYFLRQYLAAAPVAAQEPDRRILQAEGKHPAPCARFCEANAFQIEIRNLKAQIDGAQGERQPETWKVLPSPARVTGEILHQAFEIPGETWPLPAGRQVAWEQFADRVNARLEGEPIQEAKDQSKGEVQ